jgi:hypothetical protein
MASPWVAGVVALEFASNPNLTPAQAIQYLYDSATDMTHYGTGWDRYTGHGLVNAYRAVLLASGSNAKRDISEATVEALPIQLLSNGKACEPTPTVMFGYQKLREGTDYTVSYSKNTEVGYGATITVTGIGNYTGTTSSYFAIADSVPDLATSSSVDISCFTSLYDARSADHPINVGITIKTSSNYTFYLQKGIDFDYTLSDAGSDGNVNVSITGKGIFAGQNFSKKMKVSGGTDISSLHWNEIGDQAYTGKPATPIPHIFTDDNYRLSQGVDYTLSYENNVNVGTAKVTVTGKGAFTGTKTVEFKIVGPTDISASSTIKAKISRDTYTYTGSPIEPTVTVTETKPNDGPESLQCQMEGIDSPDYKVSFESNVNVGTGYIVVTGINGYTGTIRVPFKIEPADISGATIETIPTQIYTGSVLTPSVTVKLGGRTLAAGTDYTVSYSNNVEPGTATVTLTGIGNYTQPRQYNIYNQLHTSRGNRADVPPLQQVVGRAPLHGEQVGIRPSGLHRLEPGGHRLDGTREVEPSCLPPLQPLQRRPLLYRRPEGIRPSRIDRLEQGGHILLLCRFLHRQAHLPPLQQMAHPGHAPLHDQQERVRPPRIHRLEPGGHRVLRPEVAR